MTIRWMTFGGGLCAGLLAAVLGNHLQSAGKASSAYPERAQAQAPEARRISLTPELEKRARVKLEKIQKEQFTPELRLVGSVNFDADELAEVGARIDGRIATLLVTTGDEVKRGQPLAEIESSTLGSVLSDLLGTHANLIAAENNEDRQDLLFDQQLANAHGVERARAEVAALSAQARGAEQRLLSMGLTRDEIKKIREGSGSGRITLRSPIEGEVVERYAVLGQVVSSTEPILSIADLDHVWVELDVFEHDLAHVEVGNSVKIESETYPDKVFTGKVSYVDAQVSLETRSAHVRIDVDNSERMLRPGQFVRACLSTQGNTRLALTVPSTAIQRVDGQNTVFVALPGGKAFEPRQVELGQARDNRTEVLRGVREGETIVSEGAFVLRSELVQ